jgi:hypothetical protein
MRIAICLLATLTLLQGLASAQTRNPAPLSPLPPAGFQFAGSWECEGAFGNKTTHKSLFTGAVILQGKWLELTEQDVQPATGYLAKYLIGYDAQQKMLVEFDANNFGAAVYSSADGWKDNALAMTSPIAEQTGVPYAANRFIYSVTGKDTFTVDWQVSRKAAIDWIQSDHLACSRKSNG